MDGDSHDLVKVVPSIFLERLRKTTKKLGQAKHLA